MGVGVEEGEALVQHPRPRPVQNRGPLPGPPRSWRCLLVAVVHGSGLCAVVAAAGRLAAGRSAYAADAEEAAGYGQACLRSAAAACLAYCDAAAGSLTRWAGFARACVCQLSVLTGLLEKGHPWRTAGAAPARRAVLRGWLRCC